MLSHHKDTRSHTDLAKSLSFLEGDNVRQQVQRLRKNARDRPSCPIIIKRRELSLDEHRRVIWLRFGSLESAEVVWHRSCDVFKMTGVLPCTQRKIIKR